MLCTPCRSAAGAENTTVLSCENIISYFLKVGIAFFVLTLYIEFCSHI